MGIINHICLNSDRKSNFRYKDYKDDKLKYLPDYSFDYFELIRLLQLRNFNLNQCNQDNVTVSFEKKSFINQNMGMDNNPNQVYIDWLIYFKNYLTRQTLKRLSWPSKLLNKLENEYFYRSRYIQSCLFYEEFSLTTKPKILRDHDTENDTELIFSKIKNLKNDNRQELELRMTKNLGGSFEEMNYDDLLPDDPNVVFQNQRNNCKDVVKILKNLLQDEENPFSIIMNLFADEFYTYVKNEIGIIKKMQSDDVYSLDMQNKKLKDKCEDITKQLQKFIIKIQVSMKLFFCQVINYSCFNEEKDELINMITTVLFQKEKIYNCMYELYEIELSDTITSLEIKFNDLKDCTPQKLGIADKFSLNEETLKLKNSMINKKKELDKKESGEIVMNDINTDSKNNNALNQIQENNSDEEDEEEKNEEKNYFNNKDKEDDDLVFGDNELDRISDLKKFENTKFRLSKIKSTTTKNLKGETKRESDTDIANNPLYSDAFKVNLYTSFQYNARNTVTAFNNKQKNFPKLHNNLRDNITRHRNYIEKELIKNQIPPPYISAIEILKSIKKYKSPFEKMLVIASISDEITECVSGFWGDITEYAKKDFLGIEIDELMTIFLYIIIKSQMTELAIFNKMIKNFTTPTTKGTTIGYYYATLEASIILIEDLKDTNDIVKKDEQLANARITLANINVNALSEMS